ncbi:MAG: citrate/2-methylcitrate synthase [Vicinamibacterales bacterium]
METRLVSAAAAAGRIGIKRATLYAYVSRGFLTAHALPGRRGSWFDPVELDALVRRARVPAERQPDLRIKSAITLIERGRYFYRGLAPASLAQTRSYEDVAEWLWLGQESTARPEWPVDTHAADQARAALALLPRQASATDRVRVIVSIIGAGDPLRFDLRPAGAVATARRLLATTAAALGRRTPASIAEHVAAWVSPRRLSRDAVRAIETALIVMADHELAASTLAVRIAASFKADPYAAVVAGLGPMSGTWHGAASRRVEDVLRRVTRGENAAQVVGHLLHDEASVPGFGHPLYPEGDPRVSVLLPLARSFGPATAADAVLEVAAAQGMLQPNVDFALATLAHQLRLSAGAGEAIFTIGRLSGWLAHAIEEYTDRSALRLRALYVGPRRAED